MTSGWHILKPTHVCVCQHLCNFLKALCAVWSIDWNRDCVIVPCDILWYSVMPYSVPPLFLLTRVNICLWLYLWWMMMTMMHEGSPITVSHIWALPCYAGDVIHQLWGLYIESLPIACQTPTTFTPLQHFRAPKTLHNVFRLGNSRGWVRWDLWKTWIFQVRSYRSWCKEISGFAFSHCSSSSAVLSANKATNSAPPVYIRTRMNGQVTEVMSISFHVPTSYLLKVRERNLSSILQPTTRGWSVWFGFTFERLSSLYTVKYQNQLICRYRPILEKKNWF